MESNVKSPIADILGCFRIFCWARAAVGALERPNLDWVILKLAVRPARHQLTHPPAQVERAQLGLLGKLISIKSESIKNYPGKKALFLRNIVIVTFVFGVFPTLLTIVFYVLSLHALKQKTTMNDQARKTIKSTSRVFSGMVIGLIVCNVPGIVFTAVFAKIDEITEYEVYIIK